MKLRKRAASGALRDALLHLAPRGRLDPASGVLQREMTASGLVMRASVRDAGWAQALAGLRQSVQAAVVPSLLPTTSPNWATMATTESERVMSSSSIFFPLVFVETISL